MFIQTEETPNPETLKFIPGRPVMAEGTADFTYREEGRKPLLAEKLFNIGGLSRIFFGADFISITKEPSRDWMTLKPPILSTIMEYFVTHNQVVIKASATEVAENEDNEVIKEIKDLLNTRIRPYVAQDGGDITFDKYEDGIVYVHLKGACSGCPSSTLTLKSGIENMLKHYIPEVTEVRAL